MVKTEIELCPFTTPNFVLAKQPPGRREDGPQFLAGGKFPLHELSDSVLEALCKQFRDEVMEKAKAGRKIASRPEGAAK